MVEMYYLDESEIRFLTHELLPRTRSSPVDERLRGWNWHRPPLKPYSYQLRLGVWEVAARICPSNRDVWLRRKVLRKPVITTPFIARGIIIHRVVSGLFKEAKKSIYIGAVKNLRERLLERARSIIEDEIANVGKSADIKNMEKEIRDFAYRVAEYTAVSIEGKILETMAKYPFIDEEGLVNMALPFATELVIDGSFLGLSSSLRADASWMFGGLVYDVKTGYKMKWHKLQIAGYALAIESFYERPVDIGVIVYVNQGPSNIIVRKEFFQVSDDLRSRFLELRDELQMMLLKDEEPPLPSKCPRYCLLRKYCLGGES